MYNFDPYNCWLFPQRATYDCFCDPGSHIILLVGRCCWTNACL